MKEHIIDAGRKSVGRVATEAAVLLMGKDSQMFKRNIAPDVTVKITNASRVLIHGRKMEQREHKRYSGYPGGLTSTTWSEVVKKKGYGELLKRAISGMLPKNKLRANMLKRLVVEE